MLNVMQKKLFDLHKYLFLNLFRKCTFVTKSKHAEQAGAIAVIITDDNESNDNEYIIMIQDDTDRAINIPAFFLRGKDG